MGKSGSLKGVKPSGGKTLAPPASVPGSTDAESPVFCLKHMDADYGLAQCSQEDRAAFATTLHTLSQMTWQEIKLAGRHGRGAETIAGNAIKGRIPPQITSDVTLLSFRFNGMKAMVGYRDGAVFHVIWLDHNFTLYQH